MLLRYPGPGGTYEASLAHELVHAVRIAEWSPVDRQTDPGLFWEDAASTIEADVEAAAGKAVTADAVKLLRSRALFALGREVDDVEVLASAPPEGDADGLLGAASLTASAEGEW